MLAVEKGKKGRVNLVFVVGDRVLNYLSVCYERETVFTSLLKYLIYILLLNLFHLNLVREMKIS